MENPCMAIIRELNGQQGKRSMLDVVAELDWHEPPWDARIPEGNGAYMSDRGGGQYSFSTREDSPCIATYNVCHSRSEPCLAERLRHPNKCANGLAVLRLGFALPRRNSLIIECRVVDEGPVKVDLEYRDHTLIYPDQLLSVELPNQTADLKKFYKKEPGSPRAGYSTRLLGWFKRAVKEHEIGAIFATMLMLESAVNFDQERPALRRFHPEKAARAAA